MDTPKYGTFMKIGILAIMAVQFEMALTTPALGAIAQAFPNVSPNLVKQIASLPYLITIFAAPLSTVVARLRGTKFALTLGMVLIFIGGILPGFFGDIYFILICRMIFGFGYGFLFSLGPTLVNRLFEGREKEYMLGYQGGVGAFTGIIYGLLGGFLAGIFWRYAFWGFFIMIPLMVLILIAVPDMPGEVVDKTSAKGGLTGKTWKLIILSILAYVFLFSWISNTAIVIELEKVGTPAQAGLAMSVFSVGISIGGFSFGKLSEILKKYHTAFCVILFGISIMLAYYATSMTMFFVSGILYGVAFGNFGGRLYLLAVDTTTNKSLAISSMVSASCLGQFLSPILLGVITSILGLAGQRAPWLVSWPLLLVAGIVLLISVVVPKKDKPISA